MLLKKNTTEEVEYINQIEDTRDNGSIFIVLPILLELALAGILYLKSTDAVMNYLFALIPLLLATSVIGTYAYNHDADMRLFGSAASLTAIGTALQVLIDEVYHPLTTFSLIKLLAGVFIAIVFIMFYELFRKLLNRSACTYLMMFVSAAIYGSLIFFGVDPNGYGTKAWIRISGFMFQMTELTKVAAILFYASLMSERSDFSDRRILWLSNIYFVINLAGSVMIKEIGSFLILFFLHLSILYIFMNRSRKKRIYLITVFSLTAFAVVMVFVLYRVMLPMSNNGTLSGALAYLWPFVKKAYLRFSVTANINQDPYGAGYQLLQGKRALWMSGFFGNTVNFNAIPVAESDMAFIALCNGMGLIMGFLTILLFRRIMISGCKLSRKYLKRNRCDAVVVFGISVLLFLQAMIVILGSCNVIPFTGLPIPFLSRGGTYQALVFAFIGLLLHMSEKNVAEGGTGDEYES